MGHFFAGQLDGFQHGPTLGDPALHYEDDVFHVQVGCCCTFFGQVVHSPPSFGRNPELYGDRGERQRVFLRLAQQRQITSAGFQS